MVTERLLLFCCSDGYYLDYATCRASATHKNIFSCESACTVCFGKNSQMEKLTSLEDWKSDHGPCFFQSAETEFPVLSVKEVWQVSQWGKGVAAAVEFQQSYKVHTRRR